LTTINSGIDFVLHAAGIMSSYLAFSFEKFVMDDELCGILKHFSHGIEVTPETLAFNVIQNVGHDGHFLSQSQTLERCRTEFWMPELSDRSGLETWWGGDRQDTAERSKNYWQDLLANYQQPPLEPLLEKQIQLYITEQEEK